MSELVSSLLEQSSRTKRSGPLIQDLSADNAAPPSEAHPVSSPPPATPEDGGPTMLEMMMAAQAAAKKEKELTVQSEQKRATKSFGTGFKKGFLGGGGGGKQGQEAAPKAAAAIPTVKSSGRKSSAVASSIAQEVQDNMKKESHPMLQKLQEGEWVTPDLVQAMQNNAILANGLKNPKCMAALQLMQKSPAEAKQKFGSDAEVNAFVIEFGRVMGEHFSSLGEKESGGASAQSRVISSSSRPMISEVIQESSSSSSLGPLSLAALERQRHQPLGSATTQVSEQQVQEVLKDDELRSLLEDPKIQQILVECGDPAKFQQHMRNPDTARKIEKLYKAGLVGTAK